MSRILLWFRRAGRGHNVFVGLLTLALSLMFAVLFGRVRDIHCERVDDGVRYTETLTWMRMIPFEAPTVVSAVQGAEARKNCWEDPVDGTIPADELCSTDLRLTRMDGTTAFREIGAQVRIAGRTRRQKTETVGLSASIVRQLAEDIDALATKQRSAPVVVNDLRADIQVPTALIAVFGLCFSVLSFIAAVMGRP